MRRSGSTDSRSASGGWAGGGFGLRTGRGGTVGLTKATGGGGGGSPTRRDTGFSGSQRAQDHSPKAHHIVSASKNRRRRDRPTRSALPPQHSLACAPANQQLAY